MGLWKTIDCPAGVSDGIKPILISEDIAKNGVLNIKNATTQNMPTVRRVPPALIGVVPTAAGGLGDAHTAAEVSASSPARRRKPSKKCRLKPSDGIFARNISPAAHAAPHNRPGFIRHTAPARPSSGIVNNSGKKPPFAL
ncbi:hypothetical protein ACKJOL_03785 [Neisseria cinerea]|uniref:hypothetical protein n=1 Tax=Neisseria TaxID=482 RepID=UPI0039890216